MRARTTLVCIGGALPAIAIAAHGCKTATQLKVELSTNVVCADLRGVDIVVASEPRDAETRAALVEAGPRFASASTNQCTEGPPPRTIGSLVVTPSGAGTGAVVVVAAFGSASLESCKAPSFAPQCIVARRRFTFVDHEAVALPILLDPSCAGVPCNETSTCVGAKCVDSATDCSSGTCSEPGTIGPDGGLVEVDGASPLVDASPPDATLLDGANDAAKDAASDASILGGRCPASPCLSASPVACLPGAPMCCFENRPDATCKPEGAACNDIAACCRSSADCETSEICCASTAVPTPKTRITCRSFTDCSAGGGVEVCSEVPLAACRFTVCDTGQPYGTMPDYFRCS